MKNNNNLLTIIAVVVIIVGAFIFSEAQNINIKGAPSMAKTLEQINYPQFEEIISQDKETIVMVGSPSCSFCVKLTPILEEFNGKYNLEIKYLDVDKLTQEEKDKYMIFDNESAKGILTPITLVIENGKIIDRINGYVNEVKVRDFLLKRGLINE